MGLWNSGKYVKLTRSEVEGMRNRAFLEGIQTGMLLQQMAPSAPFPFGMMFSSEEMIITGEPCGSPDCPACSVTRSMAGDNAGSTGPEEEEFEEDFDDPTLEHEPGL